MAFFNGVAQDFEEMRAALLSACFEMGWIVSGSLAWKDAAAIEVSINSISTTDLDVGLVFKAGTGFESGELLNPSPITPRLGRVHQSLQPLTWPMEYSIHIFNDPVEVFLVAKFSVDHYCWAAFGISDVPGVPGTGMWLSANARAGRGGYSVPGGVSIGDDWGGGSYVSGDVDVASSSCALFWNTQPGAHPQTHSDTVHVNLDGIVWAGVPLPASEIGEVRAVRAAVPHIARSPSPWNQDAPLIPITCYMTRASSKASLVVDVRNARYIRVDNYVPGDILSLGSERWRVYPWFKKNSEARSGGNGIAHSGTYGWAIRYDGP